MKVEPVELTDKKGEVFIVRSSTLDDAEDIIRCMQTTSAETPFLSKGPEERNITIEEQHDRTQNWINNLRGAHLVAYIDGRLVGCASFQGVDDCKRVAHRCTVGIVLYKKYWRRGMGQKLMEFVLCKVKECNYTQAELEVVSKNIKAISLYKKLGFEERGRIPKGMRYSDNKYSDIVYMVKEL